MSHEARKFARAIVALDVEMERRSANPADPGNAERWANRWGQLVEKAKVFLKEGQPVPRISLLDQCAKAIQDVAHQPKCNSAVLGEGFPCGCYLQREAQLASGLHDAIRKALNERYRALSDPELSTKILEGFRRGAGKEVTRVSD